MSFFAVLPNFHSPTELANPLIIIFFFLSISGIVLIPGLVNVCLIICPVFARTQVVPVQTLEATREALVAMLASPFIDFFQSVFFIILKLYI